MNEPFRNVFQEALDGKKRFLNDVVGMNDKSRIMKYVKPGMILEVGSGSGVILDMLERNFVSTVLGMDLSPKVVESLERKKAYEDHKWSVTLGDALNLDQYVEDESLDTIIYCSILHEVYSYTEMEGKLFNIKSVETALQKGFKALRPGGRIIIRDGIMTEPVKKEVMLVAEDRDIIRSLKRFRREFYGRKIKTSSIVENTAIMPINDAMEFLYTITWGPEAYEYEVREQYGYYTKTGFTTAIKKLFGNKARCIECTSYLQPGYVKALTGRVALYDTCGTEMMPFPDSNCLVVIEKI